MAVGKQAAELAAETTGHANELEKLMAGPVSANARGIDGFAADAVRYLDGAGQTLLAAMARGKAAEVLKKRIAEPEIWAAIKHLKGMASGFATDERPAKGSGNAVVYSDSQLQDAIVDALLDGAMLSDCEINVISARKYLGVSYYRRKLRDVAKDVVWSPGIPTVVTTKRPGYQGAEGELSVWRVPAILRFTPSRDGSDGKPQVFDHSGASAETPAVAVQYRGYQDSIDAAIGKAERKLRKRAYEMILGRFTEDEPSETVQAAAPVAATIGGASELNAMLKTPPAQTESRYRAAEPLPGEKPAHPHARAKDVQFEQAPPASIAEDAPDPTAPAPAPTDSGTESQAKPLVIGPEMWKDAATMQAAMQAIAEEAGANPSFAAQGIGKWSRLNLGKVMPKPATCQNVLEAIQHGAFDWETGKVK